MEKLYTVSKTRLGADCGSDHKLLIAKFRCKFFFFSLTMNFYSDESRLDHELLIAKFRCILKKVGKTTRPFRYDLNQIPFYYTVEVRNRFKGSSDRQSA